MLIITATAISSTWRRPTHFISPKRRRILDGNKRTGAGGALLFLRGNGVRRVPTDAETYDAMIAIAERRLDKPGLAEIFRRAAVSLP